MVSILIADDNAKFRSLLRGLLEIEPDFGIVGEAADGEAALALALEISPDILLADIGMPGPSGIDIAAILRDRLPSTRVLVVSGYEDSALITAACTAGASAYVIKRKIGSQLVLAIRRTFDEETPISAVVRP